MKHVLSGIALALFIIASPLNANQPLTHELRDIPEELEHFHSDRWPQFLVNFYGSMKDTLQNIKDNLSSIRKTCISRSLLMIRTPRK